MKDKIIKLLKDRPLTRMQIVDQFPTVKAWTTHNAISGLLVSGKIIQSGDKLSIPKKTSKMRNIRTEVDGIKFDSRKEAARYKELKMLFDTEQIQRLRLQVPFIVVDPMEWNGKKLRAIKYIADFTYIQDGKMIAEDVKGRILPVYKIKRQLFLHRYPDYKLIET